MTIIIYELLKRIRKISMNAIMTNNNYAYWIRHDLNMRNFASYTLQNLKFISLLDQLFC